MLELEVVELEPWMVEVDVVDVSCIDEAEAEEEADFEEVVMVRATDGDAVATTLAPERTVETPPERTEDATDTTGAATLRGFATETERTGALTETETTGAMTAAVALRTGAATAAAVVLTLTPTIPRS